MCRYSREAYLQLVDHVRDIIPGVTLSCDFISGFCGETHADHLNTLSLIEVRT
jgi:tRNA A37 methylthiotransferase MiaB